MREVALAETKNLWIDKSVDSHPKRRAICVMSHSQLRCRELFKHLALCLVYSRASMGLLFGCVDATWCKNVDKFPASQMTALHHSRTIIDLLMSFSQISNFKILLKKTKTARVLNPSVSTTCARTGLDCASTSFKTTGCVHEAPCAVKVLYWLYWYAQPCSRILNRWISYFSVQLKTFLQLS